MKRQSVSLYEVCLAAVLIFWFLERVGMFALLTPVLFVGGVYVGFFVSRLIAFLLIWFVLWYMDKNLQPQAARGMRSHQGVAKGFDLFILLVCLAVLAAGLGAGYGTFSYFWLMTVLVGAAAVHSLVVGRERPHSAEARDVEQLGQEMGDEDDRQEPPEQEGDNELNSDVATDGPVSIEGEQ